LAGLEVDGAVYHAAGGSVLWPTWIQVLLEAEALHRLGFFLAFSFQRLEVVHLQGQRVLDVGGTVVGSRPQINFLPPARLPRFHSESRLLLSHRVRSCSRVEAQLRISCEGVGGLLGEVEHLHATCSSCVVRLVDPIVTASRLERVLLFMTLISLLPFRSGR